MLRQVVEVPRDALRPYSTHYGKRFVAQAIVQNGKYVGWRWFVWVWSSGGGLDRRKQYRFVRYEWTPIPGSK